MVSIHIFGMGKKKIVKKTEEEVLKEREAVEVAVAKTTAKAGKKVETCRIYINASYNNTLITIADKNGNILGWASAGSLGFSGPKKATPFAASKVAEVINEKIRQLGPTTIEIVVKGIGSGRDTAVRSIAGGRFNIVSIRDMTSIPHNGPRPKKVRRV